MNHHEMLRNVSRTFALSIEQLPGSLREVVTIAYLLFRVSDCLEDHETLKPGEKIELLNLWVRVLRGECPAEKFTSAVSHLDDGDPEVYVVRRAGRILRQLQQLPRDPEEILTGHVIDTSLGMARWQAHGPYVADEEEMDDYMLQVAGRVGYLLTDVFAWFSPAIGQVKKRLMPLAYEFGLALQTVNIIRGLRRDYERGWVFVPVSFYESVGLTRESLFEPSNSARAMQVIEMLSEKAGRHLGNGLKYITMIPRSQYRVRLFCIWPLLFAAKTLAVSRNNEKVLASEAKITRPQIKQIVAVSKLMSWSNRFLEAYYAALARPVLAR